ncbi:hypothetical protein EJB05_20722, partial [Eragrostis curvula]
LCQPSRFPRIPAAFVPAAPDASRAFHSLPPHATCPPIFHGEAPIFRHIQHFPTAEQARTAEQANSSDHRRATVRYNPRLPGARFQPVDRPSSRGHGDVDAVHLARLRVRAVHLPRRGLDSVLLSRAVPPPERAVHHVAGDGPGGAGGGTGAHVQRSLPYVPGPADSSGLLQAQQLFQKDSNIITPESLATVKAAIANSDKDKKAAAEATKKAVPRKAAGQSWEDPTLADWPENDFRLFCGDLGNEVNDDVLTKAFSKYPSFNMARVIRDKWTGKTKGYGFVSFANASDLAAALKEMNGKYVGNRPIKLRKSTWKNRIDFEALEKAKTQPQKKIKVQKRSVLHK